MNSVDKLKKKILIIEDCEKDFYNLTKIINPEDYDTIPNNFQEYKKAKTQNNIKGYVRDIIKKHWNNGLRLIICDLKDDEKNDIFGVDLIEEIRNDKSFIALNSPGFFNKEIPIIAYTGAASFSEQQEEILKKFSSEIVYKVTPNPNANDKEKLDYKRSIEDLQTKIKNLIKKFDEDLYKINPWLGDIELFKTKYSTYVNGFIMTSFSDENLSIFKYIEEKMKGYNIKLHIANASGGENKGTLWPNIEVFMNACDFGIAIYTDDSMRGKGNKINPNVTIETGYMLGLQKNVYICKHTDLNEFNKDYSDLKHAIYIEYKNEEELFEKLKEKLTNEGYIQKIKKVRD